MIDPERYYRASYPAPGAPDLAARLRSLLTGIEQATDVPDRGLDHGAYLRLTVMYLEADIPVLQISMPGLDPQRLPRLGAALRPLRDEGILIMGSGFLTHGRHTWRGRGTRACHHDHRLLDGPRQAIRAGGLRLARARLPARDPLAP